MSQNQLLPTDGWDAERASPQTGVDRQSSDSSDSDNDSGGAYQLKGLCAIAAVGVSALIVTALFTAAFGSALGNEATSSLRAATSWALPRAAVRSVMPLSSGEMVNETWLRAAAGGEFAESRGKELAESEGKGFKESSLWKHYAHDCWIPCGGSGLCEEFCGAGRACCRFNTPSDPLECSEVRFWPTLAYHTCVPAAEFDLNISTQWSATHLEPPAPVEARVLEAPVHRFYLYRAQNDENKYTLGNVNIANLPGVMWYLSNEVMPRCPRRYGISRIRRYLITTRATPELFAKGMNFGVRYSYDAGKCTGSNIRWLGPCSDTWDRYGYVPGCNNFRDHYPYPLVDTEYPEGIWYDLPLDGRCDSPTGARNCTWSYEEAGEVRLEELEDNEPGHSYCCHGKCTSFWWGHWDQSQCDRRLTQVLDLFAERFPDLPRDMPPPKCDFDRTSYWE